jgi:hypothetical protein
MSLACRVRYVVIDERTASEELSKFARQTFTLSLVERSADRSLYTVEGVPACRCQQP